MSAPSPTRDFAYTCLYMSPILDLHRWPDPETQDLRRRGQFTLADLQADEHGRVLELSCGRLAMNRLVSLGLTSGAGVDMTLNYGRGPLIIIVRGGRVAIGRGEARCIIVERCFE